MKRSLRMLILILMISPGIVVSQLSAQGESGNASPFSVNMDFVSRYLWRGSDFGNAPQIQPTLKFAKGGFSAGAWGSYSILGNYQEADLFALYTLPVGLSAGLSDYYLPIGNNDSTYFSSGHSLELNLGFAKGNFSISGNVMLATPTKTNDIYLELAYLIKNVNLFVGAGNEQFTSDQKFMVCNVGAKISKEIKVTDSFSIPAFGSIILNPQKEQVNLVIGLSF